MKKIISHLLPFAILISLYVGPLYAEDYSVNVEWEYSAPSGYQVSGYRLYLDGKEICQTTTPTTTEMDCTFQAEPGPSKFTLTAFFTDGQESLHSEPYPFELLEPTIKADFSVRAVPGSNPLRVTFDGSTSTVLQPDINIVQYSWNFGDGTTATGEIVNHIYQTAGSYTVILTVIDSLGNRTTATTNVIVGANNPSSSKPLGPFVEGALSISSLIELLLLKE